MMKRFSLGLLSLWVGILAASLAEAQQWQPAKGPLATRWTKDVSPDNALKEYPRPQLQREQWNNLNGLWDYAITDVHASVPAKWEGHILVPFPIESSLSGVGRKVGVDQALWYHRTLTLKAAEGKRCLLHFGAIDWHSQVWLNGHMLGEHRGGFDPFTVDLTDALNDADSQSLVVRVWDPSDDGSQPRGKQVHNPQGIFYTSVTGIWQTVWTETVPAEHIHSLRITPDVDKSQVAVTVSGTTLGKDVEIEVRDGDRQVTTAKGRSGEAIRISLKEPKLWSPDSPHLYDLVVRLNGDDQVRSYFGMRKISMGKGADGTLRMLLNDEPVFQMGPLDQGWWPDGLYTAPTDEALKYDIEITREMGFNMARKHVKVEPDRWYYWADKLGLLVWQDMPSLMARGQAQQVKPGENEDIALTAQESMEYQTEWRAIMDACYNHPSIVVWVPFNEGWGQHATNRILKWTKQYDPSRLVDGPSGWEDRGWGDLKDMHNYPGPGMFPIMSDRISVLGEFGGLGLPMEGHLWQSDRNWGYRNLTSREELADRYHDLIIRLHALIGKGLSAAVYTQTTDVEGEVNGLLTYDREIVKIDPKLLAKWHAQLKEPPPKEVTLVPSSEEKGQSWNYVTSKPDAAWMKPDFKHDDWKQGTGGFGTKETPNTHVGTTWDTSDIWLRREFTLGQLDNSRDFLLTVFHDEDAQIYINGVEAARLRGHTGSYVTVAVSPEAAKSLHEGRNVIAIHCHQTDGGQYIDAGLVQLQSAH
ncbi:MAG: sugar-binding domain-containing protein [Aureliella sp.]